MGVDVGIGIHSQAGILVATLPHALPPLAACRLQGLVDMLPQLPALRLVLPPETLSWRLQLIQQGIDWMKPRYKDVKQRALVLGSDRDMLIPSAEEAERLRKALPRARSRCGVAPHCSRG